MLTNIFRYMWRGVKFNLRSKINDCTNLNANTLINVGNSSKCSKFWRLDLFFLFSLVLNWSFLKKKKYNFKMMGELFTKWNLGIES